MREIKFRAWIVDGNDPNQVWNEDGFPTKYSMCYNLAFDDYQPINDLLASVKHLMQYTGLKDKNGKEIYEGDMVYSPQIIATSKTYAVKWDTENAGWFPFSKPAEGGYEWDSIDADTCKIVGNIYENPELLDGGEK